MNDRKMIKWLPFDSVVSSENVVRKIISDKEKITMPILSEDQYMEIECLIRKSFSLKENITITYLKNNKITKLFNYVKSIDNQNKRIILSNNQIVYYNQIIHINH